MTPYTARNFAIGGPTAREGQLDRFFFAKMAFHIQIVSEKAKNWTKNGQKPGSKSVRTDFDRFKICLNGF